MLGRARMKRIYVRACLHTNSARVDPVNIVNFGEILMNQNRALMLSNCNFHYAFAMEDECACQFVHAGI